MFGKKAKYIVAGLSLAMTVSPVVALADPITPKEGTTSAQVKKVLVLNEGSTVDATFKFKAEPVQLTVQGTGDTAEKTAPTTEVPAATINDISFSSNATGDKAEKAGNNEATADITVTSFPHAGYYAWKVTEVTSGEGFTTVDGMQYNTTNKVYTLIAQVANDGTVTYVLVDGEATTVTNTNKAGSAEFTNKYTESANGEGADLTITKKVTGNQGDKTKDFTFTVTFTAPTVKPYKAGTTTEMTDDEYFKQLGVAGDATEVSWNEGHTAVTFKLKDGKTATFTGLVAGTKYTVAETAEAGYTQYLGYTANGSDTGFTGEGDAKQATGAMTTEQILAGENANSAVVRNDHKDVTPTGIVINNMPYIVMAGAAVAGVVAYGAAKRKLEK